MTRFFPIFATAVVTQGRVISDSEGHTSWHTDRAKDHHYLLIRQSPHALTALIGSLMAVPPKSVAGQP